MDSPLLIGSPRSCPLLSEDVLLQYVFEDENGLYPLDGMFFRPDKRGTKILFSDSSGKGDVLYGVTDNGNLIWDANGNLYDAGPHSKGFQAYGKMGPGSVYSNLENIESREDVDRQDARLGSATMLAALLESPVVQNLVAGLGPNGETSGDNYVKVQEARKAFADPRKPFFPRGGARYEDGWPRLMRFIGAVNAAFNKREVEGGAPNPLFELMFGNSYGRDSDLGDAMLYGGFDKIGLDRLPGESDEDFYRRQADNINRHRETLNLRDEVSAERYYDWVIDKMVRNLRAAAKSLLKRDKELNRRRKEKGRSPYGEIRMYQMAVPGDKIVTLDDFYSGRQAVAPVLNSNMRMVAIGVLLGGTGMPLKEVIESCNKYFMLRMTGKHGREAFGEIFYLDPDKIP